MPTLQTCKPANQNLADIQGANPGRCGQSRIEPSKLPMPLSWNEIKSRALTFSRTWADAANEDSQGKPFWIDFFEIFGITNKRVATACAM